MINLGLQRISLLLQPLFQAHPALPWKAIHIAGTNGKGSVAALLSTCLSQPRSSRRCRVGRFTSPHTVDRWDCITLDQRVVNRESFLAAERRVQARNVEAGIGASEFEVLTATAFELFTDHGMDVAVVECGLGGRLDATNVLRSQDVLVSVLTKVGLDHVEFLGDTLPKVAAQKTGIFKSGVPVVVDPSNPPEVMEVVQQRLKQLRLESEGRPQNVSGVGPSVLPERYKSLLEGGQFLDLGLATHQRQNVVTALTAYDVAVQRLSEGRPTDVEGTDHVENVVKRLPDLVRAAQASLPGRLQWLSLPKHLSPFDTTKQVLLDGAHNPQSAEGLAEYVSTHLRSPTRIVTWVLAVKKEKDVRSLLSILLRPSDNVVTCSFGPVDGMPWVQSTPAAELAEIAREFVTSGKVEVGRPTRETGGQSEGDVAAAIKRAVEIAGDGKIGIAGSLYLVGDVLRLVRDGEAAAAADADAAAGGGE
jgi:folylpolyglutamate synthase